MRLFIVQLTKWSFGAWVCAALLTSPLSAQDSPPPTSSYALAQNGYKAYQEGKYEEAVKLLEQLTTKYPTAEETPNGRYLLGLSYYSLGKYEEGVKALSNTQGLEAKFLPVAQFHLAVCLYLTGSYDKAYPLLESVAKSDNKEMQPFALFYYGRAKLDQAGKNPAVAKQAAADGAAKIDTLVKTFPDSDVIPDALMTKANLFIVARDFLQAADVLKVLKERPDAKDIELDIEYLLGYSYTQQAKALRDEFKYDDAAEAIVKAREVYERLAKNENLIVANNAAFQLADLEFDAAVVAEPQEREAAFQKAINAYRSLKSKDSLITSQEQIVKEIRDDIGKNVNDKKRVAALTRQLQREEQKLASLKNSADQATSGLMRVGDAYLRMGKYDEARIVYRAALPTAAEEQGAAINAQIISTYALQGQSQKAEDAYTKFKQEHANDPNAANIPYLLGIALTQEKKYEEAIQKFDQVLKDFPTSKIAANIPQAKATAYLAWGKVDLALKSYDDFISTQTGKVDPEAIDNAKLLRGYALLQAGKFPEAIKGFQELASKAKNPAVREEAAMRAGDYLNRTGKQQEAIETFQTFIKNFPDSSNTPTAAYSIGFGYEGLKKYPEAIQAYQDAIAKYPNDKANQLKCYERIWRSYLAADDYDNMVKAQDTQVAAFPDSDRNMTAYLERAKYLTNKNKPLEDISAAYLKVVDAYNALPESMKTGDMGKKNMVFPSYALLQLSGLYQKEALKLGNFEVLPEDKLGTWKDYINNAYKYVDMALQKFNQANLGLELQNMNRIQLFRIKAKMATPEDATTYLSTLAGILNDKAASIQIMIARAAFVYEMDNKVQALSFYKEAFGKVSKPTDITWQDYDRYGSILLDNQNWQDAKTVFETLKATYEKPPQAQAAATYGLGAVDIGLGNPTEAEAYFKELKEKYPWSEKLLNADYQRGLAQAGQGHYAEALKIWKVVMNSPSNNNEIKSRALISFANTLIIMGDKNIATDEIKQKDKPDANIYELAAQYGLKSHFYYPDEASSPEGLYIAISVYSEKLHRKADAKKWFETLSQKYPTSTWTTKAQAFLN